MTRQSRWYVLNCAAVLTWWMRGMSERFGLLATLWLLLVPSFVQAAPVRRPDTVALSQPELQAYVDGVVEEAMKADTIGGVGVTMVYRGSTIFQKGYGIRSSHPIRPVDPSRTLFRIGSISKIFTWILLMKEVERGRIRLTDPVNDYLPPSLKIPEVGFSRSVTFLDLMSHAAGFDGESRGEFVGDPARFLPLEQRLRQQFPSRVREPGMVSSYSDQGVEFAGYIVARLNGVDFETLAEREIFVPLGLRNTTFRQPYPARDGLPRPMSPGLAANVSTGFGVEGLRLQARPFEYTPGPSGSVSTTAEDMGRFMLLMLNGGTLDGVRIYSPATAQAFRTEIMHVPPTVNGWAHGLEVSSLPGGYRGYGHGGGMLSFKTGLVVVPELQLGIFVSTNTESGRSLRRRLPELIVRRFFVDQRSPLPAAADPSLLRQRSLFAGHFIAIERPYFGLTQFDYLIRREGTARITDDGMLQFGGTLWVPDGARDRFRSADGDEERLYVKYGADGRVAEFIDESGTGRSVRRSLLYDKSLFLLLAASTLVMAVVIAIGAAVRFRHVQVGSALERWSARGLAAAALLWLIFFAGLAQWLSVGTLEYYYNLPGPSLVLASFAALCATAISGGLVAATPFLWARPDGWTWRQRLPFSFAVALFAAFGIMLALWGALLPWMD